MLIAPELRASAGLVRDVMLLGMGSHFELWDAKRHAEHEAAVMQSEMPESLQELQLLSVAPCPAHRSPRSWQAHHRPAATKRSTRSCTTPDGIYVDGTFGRGGHSRLLLSRLSPQGRLVAIDRDPQAVAAATRRRNAGRRTRVFPSTTPASRTWRRRSAALGIDKVDGVLLDLGVSSPQIDDPARGFSFRFDGPLDMRMDTTRGESAADFLARADERQIAEVIRDYGEERFAVQIAKALVARRESGNPVRTTGELSERRGWCGQDPRSGPGPCNAHISGSSDFRQRRA